MILEDKKQVVLVDEYGHDLFNEYGKLSTAEKMDAHRRGLLHRAVSVFVFNDIGELLLQQRASSKYHSPQIWSNTCCTHTSPAETPTKSAHRRLIEEMGLEVKLTEAFTFIYQSDVGNGLTEKESDHVFLGASNQSPKPDPSEVSDWKWMSLSRLHEELISNPEKYSPWLRQCFDELVKTKSRLN